MSDVIEWREASDGSFYAEPVDAPGILLTVRREPALSVKQYRAQAWGYHPVIRPVMDREREEIARRPTADEAKQAAETWLRSVRDE